MLRSLELLLLVLLLAAGTAHAQSDTIIPNPKAVKLRSVWNVQGNNTGDRVGAGAGSVSDINGDSINDIAVYATRIHGQFVGRWSIYLGANPAPSKQAVWTMDSLSATSYKPLVVDFRGDGHISIGFVQLREEIINGFSRYYFVVKLFAIDSSHLATAPSDTTPKHEHLRDVQAANLDGQPGDELVVMKQSDTTGIASLWFYQGGTDFQLQTPTAVLYDYEGSTQSDLRMTLGDLDGDHKPDLILGAGFKTGYKLKFYFSDANSPYSWATRPPDREITMADRVIGLNVPLRGAYDLDGDSVLDLAGITYNGGDKGGSFIYLSNSGKNVRTRSFTLDDADIFFKSDRYLASPIDWGYINDSLRRYRMLTLTAGPVSLGFSGGPHGPDAVNEAYYTDLYGVFGWGSGPVGDVTGDGWEDVLAASPFYGALPDMGIAMVLAGGPYIPRDPSLGVREVAVAGKRDGLSLWPNPVREELNIAWRGDLKQMPNMFEIHDLLGRRIAGGTVEPWRGQALWHCADMPAGTYLLSVFDDTDSLIATTEVIKQ